MRRAVCRLQVCRPSLLAQRRCTAQQRPQLHHYTGGILPINRSISHINDQPTDSILRRLLSSMAQQIRDPPPQNSYSRMVSEPVSGPTDESSDVFGSLSRMEKKRQQRTPVENDRRKEVPKHNFPKGHEVKETAVPVQAVATEYLGEDDLFGIMDDPDYHKLKEYRDGNQDELPTVLPFRQRPWWYLLRMKKLIQKEMLPEALEFFEVKMRAEDNVRPLRTVYDMLIAACGRAGYYKKAYSLFIQMKQHEFQPVDATYVGVFNAFAECPKEFHGEALKKAHKLREELHLKGHTPNQIVYHSMIKAFGRTGDMVTAFQLADEMVTHRICIADSTFSFLLMACITDQHSGLKHAIKVWRLMLASGATPDLYMYKLLLKAVRSCGLGDPESAAKELLPPPRQVEAQQTLSVFQQTLNPPKVWIPEEREFEPRSLPSALNDGGAQSVTNQVLVAQSYPKSKWSKKFYSETARPARVEDITVEDPESSDHPKKPLFSTTAAEWKQWSTSPIGRKKLWFEKLTTTVGAQDVQVSPSSELLVVNESSSLLPDLLVPRKRGQTSEIVAFREGKTPIERMELFGGYLGFLARMHRDGVVPDKSFLTQLIEVLPPTAAAEEAVIRIGIDLAIRMDTDFYNILIRKRTARQDMDGALDIFRLIEERGLLVNEMTFGCLAFGCRTQANAEELLLEMKNRGLKPNIKIFGSFCGLAIARKDMFYLLFILHRMEKYNVSPDERILDRLEAFRIATRKELLKLEKRLPVDGVYTSDTFQAGWRQFTGMYKSWLMKTAAPVKEHPWTKYGYRRTWPSLEQLKLHRAEETARLA
ncbi:putative Pentatricopeptide repeat-containing protein 1, mitochondrial [Hypsibius exemplaris]|uniref:Pentatricopeptide repeat-containing protein 1, mitochondrial n=1 Tax=Hypsibius exemplaris TaxID=2072580 RepID=A0A1W0WDH4_HYPEX|nr:putative Pentatricopeptide repeat-containing protein 1, mitochondrial [Hypsibius exemplaris]